uniref:AIG1-type G domain-containing protein n=3 Tax=Sparus aurata TaxID=8175 RepID=A0A671UDB8_SPAAU
MLKEKEIVLINTPDLLHPNMSEDRLREHVETCERFSDPGPHVFLLVLQPEDFTEEHKLKLCRVLNLFSDQSFDHSLVLISTPREESPGLMETYHQHPPLKEMIRDCHYRFLWQKHLEPAELLTRLGQVVKEHDGKHLNCRSDMEDLMMMRRIHRRRMSGLMMPHSLSEEEEDEDESPVRRSSSFEFLPPNMSELRVVLLGNSWSQRSSVGNFILGTTVFNTEEEPDRCVRVSAMLKEKEIVLINTPDLLHPNIPEDRLRRNVETCERLSDPGPHVFLLVLQPEDFTEEHKLKLCRVLNLFSHRSLDHSLVLISTPREESPGLMETYHQHPPLKEMIRDCHYRFLWQKHLEPAELLTRLGQVVKEHDGKHLNCRSDMEDLMMMRRIHRRRMSGLMMPHSLSEDNL